MTADSDGSGKLAKNRTVSAADAGEPLVTRRGVQREPSIKLEDVARKAGVSRSLASLALRGDPGVSPERRDHILKIAEELRYRPNIAARNLASIQSRAIGILIGDLLNPFEALLARNADAAARRSGYESVVSINGMTDSAALVSARALMDQRVAGIILIGAPKQTEVIARISKKLPTVYIGRDLSSFGVDSVCTDDALGARMATEHLASLGHKLIAHVNGGSGAGAQMRVKGYRQALKDKGLTANIIPGEYSIDAGSKAVDALIGQKARPTAIFTANDMVAIGAINRLAQVGLRVPEDVAVVGYDDIPLASSESISLTTIRQRVDLLIDLGIDALFQRMQDPERPIANHVTPPELIVRRSSGKSLK